MGPREGEDAAERDPSARWPTVGIRAGAALLTEFDSRVRLDSDLLGRGTEIDLEDEFGLRGETNIARGDLWWRIDDDRRHRVELSVFDIRRSGTRQIQREIQFGDEVFAINSTVEAFFDTTVIKGNYRYNFYVDDDLEVGASIGVHGIGLTTGLSQGDVDVRETFDAPVPLPVVGLAAEWLPFDRVRFLAATDALYVKLDDIGGGFGTEDLEGYLLDVRAGIEWEPIDHFGLGIGYNFFQLDAEYGEDLVSLNGRYRYSGLLLYGTLSF